MKRTTVLVDLWVVLVYGFMYLPIAVILLFSLNASEIIAFPLQGFTTQWFREVFTDTRLAGGLRITFMVSIPVALYPLSSVRWRLWR